MKKFNKLQENSEDSSMNSRIKLMNKINEITIEIEIIKKDQTEILKLKNSMNEI